MPLPRIGSQKPADNKWGLVRDFFRFLVETWPLVNFRLIFGWVLNEYHLNLRMHKWDNKTCIYGAYNATIYSSEITYMRYLNGRGVYFRWIFGRSVVLTLDVSCLLPIPVLCLDSWMSRSICAGVRGLLPPALGRAPGLDREIPDPCRIWGLTEPARLVGHDCCPVGETVSGLNRESLNYNETWFQTCLNINLYLVGPLNCLILWDNGGFSFIFSLLGC